MSETPERGSWGSSLEFILSCLGFAVGLGNVWRFPFMAYKNGGGVFYIPYWTMLITLGIPMILLEMAMGQFSSRGNIKCWRFARLFTGIGIAQCIVSFLTSIYYNMIIAWSMYYLGLSFTALPGLPWETCQPEWGSDFCMTNLDLELNQTELACTSLNYTALQNGVCQNLDNKPHGFWNYTKAKEEGIQPKVPTEDYLNRVVLKKSSSISEIGTPIWQLVVALIGAWTLVVLCMFRGIQSTGKVVYFTATFPYVILLVLFVKGLMLENYDAGIKSYFTPNVTRLSEVGVWRDAAGQVFFSLSASWGGMITLSSYNRFHNNILRDTFIIAIADSLTSMFAGSVIFCYLGFLSGKLGIAVDAVFAGGPTLAFQVFPYAVTQIPGAPVWSVLFFLMLIILGIDSQFVMIETILSAIVDTFPTLRKGYKKTLVLIGICTVGFLCGIIMTCPGGSYWLDLFDGFVGGWTLMAIAAIECIAIFYFYGFIRFRKDILVILQETKVCTAFFKPASYVFGALWAFITPAIITGLIIMSIYFWKPMDGYPIWSMVLGWMIFSGTLLSIVVTGIIYCVIERNQISTLIKPTIDWGPAEVKHRALINYVPGFIVDPYNEGGKYELYGDKERPYSDEKNQPYDHDKINLKL